VSRPTQWSAANTTSNAQPSLSRPNPVSSPRSSYRIKDLSISLEDIRPALLLGPQLLVMRLGVNFELLQVGIDDLLAAVGALFCTVISLLLDQSYSQSSTSVG